MLRTMTYRLAGRASRVIASKLPSPAAKQLASQLASQPAIAVLSGKAAAERPRLFSGFAKDSVPVKQTPVTQEPSSCLPKALEMLEAQYGDPATRAKQYQHDVKFEQDDWKTVTIRELLTGGGKNPHGMGTVWLQSTVNAHEGLVSIPKLTAESLESFLKNPKPPGKSCFYSCTSALKNGNINSGIDHFHHHTQVPEHPEHGFRDSVAIMVLDPKTLPDYILDRKVAVSTVEKNGHAGKGTATQVHVAPYLLPFIDAYAQMIIKHGKTENSIIKKTAGYWNVSKKTPVISDKILLGSACGTLNQLVDESSADEARPTKGPRS